MKCIVVKQLVIVIVVERAGIARDRPRASADRSLDSWHEMTDASSADSTAGFTGLKGA